MDRIANTVGHYDAYGKNIEFDKDMNLKDGIFSEDGKHRSLNDDEKEYYKKMIVEKINKLYPNEKQSLS